MENDKIIHGCKTCKYFLQHYIRYKTSFHKIFCGHCTNIDVKAYKRQKFPYISGCNKWEQAEENSFDNINAYRL